MKSIVKPSIAVGILLALIFIPIIVYYLSLNQNKDHIKKEVKALSDLVNPSSSPTKESQLGEIVNKHFSKYGKDYAVVIKNLKTGEEYGFNENIDYGSASLYKLWVMGAAFQKIKDGDMNESEVLSAPQKKLDEILFPTTPTPSLENPSEEKPIEEKPVEVEIIISMTTENALNKMIKLSDNYAALLLASKVGTNSVTNFLKQYNFSNSSFMSPPHTTASDIANYFELLYKGEIIDKEYSDKMLSILKGQTINDRIPKYLPEDTVIAHKTGELFGAKHDAGIVYSEKGDYIIVVMSNTKSEAIAAENIAKFSQDIYKYFESN